MKDEARLYMREVAKLLMKVFVMLFILPIYKLAIFRATVCYFVAEKIDYLCEDDEDE